MPPREPPAKTSNAPRDSVRSLILNAATSLLKEQGIAALTQPQIAKAAGISQSHLTYYFPTRAALHQAVAEHAMQMAFDSVTPQDSAASDKAALTAVLQRVISEGIPPRAMIGLVVAADGDPKIRKLLARMIRKIRGAMQKKLDQSGLQASDEDTLLFHASLIGLAVMHLARQNKESEREVQIGLEALVRRMAKPARRKSKEMP
ncbi:MAG: TetR/AcrR family transcriptional regulator [Georgfuchsia sp.]